MASTPAPALTFYQNMKSLHGTWDEGMLILMYHAIEDQIPGMPWPHLYVGPKSFRGHIRELKDAGVSFVRASEALSDTRERRAWITIDDGFQNVHVNAAPILKEMNVPAITYIVGGQIGGTNLWDHSKGLLKKPLMTREEILEWVGAGLEIGAHTMTHCNLAQVPIEQARAEIFDCKKVLEDLIGQPVLHFCYPYGGMNDAVRDLVSEAGYETATSCQVGYNLPDTDPFTLRRLMACQ